MYLNPKWIIVEFLRNRLIDPRNRAEDIKTEEFTAKDGQKEFVLSPDTSLSSIISVEDNSQEQKKWRDYYIDLRNHKIVFFSGRTAGNLITISYKQGSTNWIYPDKPVMTLSSESYPRISVSKITGTGLKLGRYDAPMESSILFQIDIWTKEKAKNQVFDIDGDKYSGELLADYFALKVVNAFEKYEDDLHPALYNAIIRQIPRDLPFDETYQAFHKQIEVELNTLNLGYID